MSKGDTGSIKSIPRGTLVLNKASGTVYVIIEGIKPGLYVGVDSRIVTDNGLWLMWEDRLWVEFPKEKKDESQG